MRYLLLLLLITVSVGINAQNCPDITYWQGVSYIDDNTGMEMALPILIKITKEKISTYWLWEKDKPPVEYNILSSNCTWDSDYKEGSAAYKVELVKSKKLATIFINKDLGSKKIYSFSIEFKDNEGISPDFKVTTLGRKYYNQADSIIVELNRNRVSVQN